MLTRHLLGRDGRPNPCAAYSPKSKFRRQRVLVSLTLPEFCIFFKTVHTFFVSCKVFTKAFAKAPSTDRPLRALPFESASEGLWLYMLALASSSSRSLPTSGATSLLPLYPFNRFVNFYFVLEWRTIKIQLRSKENSVRTGFVELQWSAARFTSLSLQ